MLDLPSQWRLPRGFTVEIRVVSDRHIQRVAGIPVWGFWTGFGSTVLGKTLDERTGRIYINSTQDQKAAMATLKHEMQHALLDWEPKE